jgi:hypothetical protein
MATNRLTVRPYSIVNHIIYDKENEKARRMVIDAETNETMEFYAKIVLSMHLLWVQLSSVKLYLRHILTDRKC